MRHFAVVPWNQPASTPGDPLGQVTGWGLIDRRTLKVHTSRKRPHRAEYTFDDWIAIAAWLNKRTANPAPAEVYGHDSLVPRPPERGIT